MPPSTARTRCARIAAVLAVLGALLALPSAAPAAGDGAFAGAALTGTAATLRAAAAAPPTGFQETIALSGLTKPTAVRFAPDGRIFVAEKGGQIKVFDDFGDPTPTVYADLRQQVHDFWDRGLLGLALDPQFTAGRPYVYVLYAYNKDPSSAQFPRWGDSCPTPPGATDEGCVISGRLSRLNGAGEQVLIEDWCQQYPSHSLGSLAFGADGGLYVSGGDGASFNFADYGQDGSPRNPCGDPTVPVGGAQTPPTAEGGALRSQDVRTTGDPTSLSGAILRVDPDTGAAAAGNPNTTGDPNARRIVAHGLRNPFRITVRPGTSEVWAGDVGWNAWEEINRVPTPIAEVRNFGWPCYEGTGRVDSYDNLDLNLCENLYDQGSGAHAAPYYTYNHSARVVTGEACGTGSSSISGLAFNPPGGSFPAAYDGALFFSDYSRDCIWAMLAGSNGLPDPNNRQTFVSAAANPVELQFGPGGDLYYVDLGGGTIRRVRSLVTNRAPVARATATPSSGNVPLTVAFDGTTSSDPDGQPITYAWDLDGDGAFDDSTSATPSFTYTVESTYTARLRVRDAGGLEDTVNVPITAGSPPVPIIDITSPTEGTMWKVDDTIAFSGTATDFQGNPIAASGLTWDINLRHCDRVTGSCHTHPLQSFSGVANGSFPAPDHEFPSHLEIELTARDSHGLSGTATRRLDPNTVQLTLASQPPGLRLTLGAETVTAPFTREVIQGSTNGIGTDTPQTLAGVPYTFASWSNAGARNHTTAVDADTTLTATFERSTLLSVSPASLSYSGTVGGSNPAARDVAVANTGGGSLPFTATDDASWVTVTPGNGSAPQNLSVAVNTAGLTTGTHTATVRVESAGVEGSPTLIPVSLTLSPAPPPALSVTPASLSFSGVQGGGSPPSQSLSVANTGSGTLSFTTSDDQPWLSVAPASGNAPATLSVSVSTTGLTRGTYSGSVTVTAAGATGSPATIPVTLTVSRTPPASTGLVGAWGFDEPSGKAAKDASGAGNHGTLSGATRFVGRYGGGLSFDGVNDWVRMPDAASLDLTNGMTMEAWVRPAALGTTWRTVVLKEQPGRLVYALYASTNATRPSAHIFTTTDIGLQGRAALPLNRWSHLASTWDGATLRLFVNGKRIATSALAGTARTSTSPLRIGGNAVWPEWFKGLIDEVRVYNRALTPAQIAADRDTPVGGAGATSPSVKRAARANAKKARAKAKRAEHRGKPRETRRRVHRGTRWLERARRRG